MLVSQRFTGLRLTQMLVFQKIQVKRQKSQQLLTEPKAPTPPTITVEVLPAVANENQTHANSPYGANST